MKKYIFACFGSKLNDLKFPRETSFWENLIGGGIIFFFISVGGVQPNNFFFLT